MEASEVIAKLKDGLGPVILPPSHLKKEREGLDRFLRKQGGFEHSAVFATSGTSANRVKWVILNHHAMVTSAAAVNEHLQVVGDDHMGNCLPEFHVGGFSSYVRADVAGCSVSTHGGKWDPSRFVDFCKDRSITITSLVPTQVYDLVRDNCSCPQSLRCIVVGGGAVSDALYDGARSLGWPLLRSYGMTEASSQIATQVYGEKGPFLKILPHWKCRSGNKGILEISGDALFSAYVFREDADFSIQRPFLDDWFSTKDIVKMDNQQIFSVRRADSQVKVLGELVDLTEIETFLNNGLLRDELLVFAKKDDRTGHKLIPVMTDASLTMRCKQWSETCPGFMRLEDPLILSSLPRTPLGKIHRAKIHALLNE